MSQNIVKRCIGVVTSIALVLASSMAFGAEVGGPKFAMLPAGDVKPHGWILKQMDLDLREGLAGNYPKVSSIVDVEIFANKNGTLAPPYVYPGGKVARSWWVGEVEGNWLDSVVRLAFLTGQCRIPRASPDRVRAHHGKPATGAGRVYRHLRSERPVRVAKRAVNSRNKKQGLTGLTLPMHSLTPMH